MIVPASDVRPTRRAAQAHRCLRGVAAPMDVIVKTRDEMKRLLFVYHCQQAAEKALKGYLVYRDERVERTHDLGLLLERAMEIEPVFGSWIDAADRLAPYATAYRYPGTEAQAEREELDEALDDAETILVRFCRFRR